MTGTVKLYLDGVEVLLAIPVSGSAPDEIAANAAAQVRAYLKAGFTTTPDAEQTALIGVVVRRQHIRDGRTTPVIDMYRVDEYTQKRWLGVYLNTPADVQAFERAAGARLDDFPLFDGDAPLQLDVEAQQERVRRYAVRLKTPFWIVWRLNPKYDENDKKTSKRLLVRYLDSQTPTAPTASDGASSVDEEEVIGMQMIADGKAWVVGVITRKWSRRVPAELVRSWSLSEGAKKMLRDTSSLDVLKYPCRAVTRDGQIIDVIDGEIPF